MLNFKNFIETPLASYNFHMPSNHNKQDDYLDFDVSRNNLISKTGEFHSRDKAVITHPKTASTLERWLQPVPYKFNILFYEGNDKQNIFLKNVENFMTANNIVWEGHITFVKNASTGEPQTPWMTLHNLGHALIQSKYIDKISIKMFTVFNKENIEFKDFLKMFQFRSAQKGYIGLSMDEFCYELVAEYLTQGQIRFNIPPDLMKIKPEIDGFVSDMTKYIKSRLKQSVGKIITDFFRYED